MPVMGLVSFMAAVAPENWASPKAKVPAAAAVRPQPSPGGEGARPGLRLVGRGEVGGRRGGGGGRAPAAPAREGAGGDSHAKPPMCAGGGGGFRARRRGVCYEPMTTKYHPSGQLSCPTPQLPRSCRGQRGRSVG